MIPFKLPQLSMTLRDYMRIVELQARAGSCVGFFIGLGKTFFEEGIAEVDEKILPTLANVAPRSVNPRVIPSYAILLWFSMKVNCCGWHAVVNCTSYNPQILEEAGMSDLKEQVTEFVAGDILTIASKLQSGVSSHIFEPGQQELNSLGKDIVKCASGLSKMEVRQ